MPGLEDWIVETSPIVPGSTLSWMIGCDDNIFPASIVPIQIELKIVWATQRGYHWISSSLDAKRDNFPDDNIIIC